MTSTEAAGTSVARTVTMLYDAAGQMTGMINGRGYLTAYVYDAAGRQTVVVDALNHRTTSTLDGNGNVTQIEDAANRFTTMVYDSLNRQIEVIDATNSPSTTYYDAVGNVTSMRDGNNLLTQYQVDSLNRVTVTIDPRNYRTTTQFDAVGNITAITDASNNTSTFAYDSLNRKVTETDALGNSATFAYNAVGLLTSSTDRLGRRRDFAYDVLNRRTTEIWYSSGGSATETMTYSFDAGGNQLTATDSDGTYTMTYNELNQVTQVEDLWGNILTFTYDDAGNRTIVEDSEGGVETSTYDAANNLTYREISGIGSAHIHIDIDYDNRNQIDQIQRYTGSTGPYTSLATSDYSYDEKGRIENLAHDNGSVFANYTYTYDNGGRLTVEELNGTPTTYSYDNSNQLTDDGVNSLSFDGTGNRTNGSYATGTGNRIASDGTWTYSYDDEGNITKKSRGTSSETWTYGYDHRNQMTLAQKWDKDPDLNGDETLLLEADYSYDVFGNRIEKNVDVDGDSTPDITVRYAYDGWKPGDGFIGNENWDVWGDFNSSDTLVDRYVRGDTIDQLFARIDDSGDPYWLLNDHLGSVRDVVDNTGTVVKTVSYDGYGNIISQAGTGSLGRYAWTGREIETETGLQYNRARYYNPAIGRWTSQDPLGFDAGDTNLYRYVNNAPTMGSDPSGLQQYGGYGGGYYHTSKPVVSSPYPDPVWSWICNTIFSSGGLVEPAQPPGPPQPPKGTPEAVNTNQNKVQTILNRYRAHGKAKQLFEVAEKKLGKIHLEIADIPFRADFNDQARLSNGKTGPRIRLSSKLANIDTSVGLVLFEVLRAVNQDEQHKLHNIARKGILSKEAYIEKQERLGYDLIKEQHDIAESAIKNDIWGEDSQVFRVELKAWTTFDKYYEFQKKIKTHTKHFGDIWELYYRKIYEARNK